MKSKINANKSLIKFTINLIKIIRSLNYKYKIIFNQILKINRKFKKFRFFIEVFIVNSLKIGEANIIMILFFIIDKACAFMK